MRTGIPTQPQYGGHNDTHCSGVLMDMLPRRLLNNTAAMIPTRTNTIRTMTATTPPMIAAVLSPDVVDGSRVKHSFSLKLEMTTEH